MYRGEESRVQDIWSGGLKERDYSQDLGLDGRVILRKMLNFSVERAWSRLLCLSHGGFL